MILNLTRWQWPIFICLINGRCCAHCMAMLVVSTRKGMLTFRCLLHGNEWRHNSYFLIILFASAKVSTKMCLPLRSAVKLGRQAEWNKMAVHRKGIYSTHYAHSPPWLSLTVVSLTVVPLLLLRMAGVIGSTFRGRPLKLLSVHKSIVVGFFLFIESLLIYSISYEITGITASC